MRVVEGGRSCLKYLKSEGSNRKERTGNKDFENGGKAGSRGRCLKKWGGLEPPYELCIQYI